MIGLAKLAHGAGHLALAERPERPAGPGEALVDVLGTGVCGTDLHIEAGEYPANPPITLGHEISGRVSAIGAGVDPAWLGEHVVCETIYSTCGTCRTCREGRPNLCGLRRSIGTHVDGGFAPRVVVPAVNLHRVPSWVDEHVAAVVEPLACVCQCLLDPAAVAPGDRVLVVGPGPIGVLAAQVARSLGGDVIACGLPADAERLDTARALGLAATDDVARIGEVDVAIETSGSAAGAAAGLERVRQGGRFVQIGIFGQPVTVPLDLVLRKELELSTGFASTPRAWSRALALVERRAIGLDGLVSEVAPLADWSRVFADLRVGRGMKVVLDPRIE